MSLGVYQDAIMVLHRLSSLLLLSVIVAATGQFLCYQEVTNPYLLFSSKTAYEFVHDDQDVEVSHPGCEPRQFWLLSRHGTRYPKLKDIEKMISKAPTLQADVLKHPDIELCDADIENLRNWKLTVDPADDYQLTTQGFLDLYNLAKRFQKRFPSLLDIPYNQSLHEFRAAISDRTLESSEAFAEGLFGLSTSVYLPAPIEPDPLIESYDACPAWLQNVDGNPASTAEQDAFIASGYVSEVVAEVSNRLGFDSSPLKYSDIDLIYDLCRYDKAWRPNKLAPWCASFTPDNLLVLEYIEDLKYYYTESYGNDLNPRVGCPPVKDFVERFSRLAAGTSDEPLGVFYFSHSTMLNMVLSRLGLYEDVVRPTSANFLSQQNREWRSSMIGSFASNVAAVWYECEDKVDRFELYVEEHVVQVPGCPQGELCEWTVVKELLAAAVDDCDMAFCQV